MVDRQVDRQVDEQVNGQTVGGHKLIVYADDATGAMEVAGAAAAHGMKVHMGSVADDVYDCLVVNAQSRHMSEEEIDQDMPAMQIILQQLQQWPDARLMHKMDSTLRGNWAKEIKVLSDLTDKQNIIVIAAYPKMGRLCIDGHVTVDGELVHRTAMAQDPLAPIQSSNVGSYLSRAGIHLVCTAYDDADAFTKWIERQESGAIIAQVRDQEQFTQVLELSKYFQGLLAGTSAVAAVLAGQLHSAYQAMEYKQAKTLIICGSLHPRSQEQLAWLQEHAAVDVGIDVELCECDQNITAANKEILIIKTPTRRDGGHYGDLLVAAVRVLLKQEAAWQQIIVIGGETLFSLADDGQMQAIGEMESGIPCSSMQINGHAMKVISKAGAYGEVDFFKRILNSEQLTEQLVKKLEKEI
ncbi:MAG: hypothetical protein HRU15_02665 [Planctomycetes bacterium]|nr:hypothetical protein [Planctomycetota bacterium]